MLGLLSKKALADDVTNKREWRRALRLSAGPNALLISAMVGTLIGHSRSSSRSISGGGFNERTGVTLSKFNQVREGMRYSEVVESLGQSGKEMRRSILGGTTTVMYSWDAPGFASMNAMFQDDRLVSKSQLGRK